MTSRKASRKEIKKCGGLLIPGIQKYVRRPCERCKRYTPGELAIVERLIINPQTQTYTCQFWI